MIDRRVTVRRWKLLRAREASDLVKDFERHSQEVPELYAELRRRDAKDDGPGYPARSGGGGSSSAISDRTADIAVKSADGDLRDPVRELLVRGEALLFEVERSCYSGYRRSRTTSICQQQGSSLVRYAWIAEGRRGSWGN
jgi:hypothetical protein